MTRRILTTNPSLRTAWLRPSAVLFVLLSGACSKAPAVEAPLPYAVGENSVRFSKAASSPVRFDTEVATLGPPVSAPSVTGRVTTVERLTSHSFAPLRGRVSELRVSVGDRVQKGDRLLRVQTSELASIEHDVQAAKLAIGTKRAMLDRLRKLSEFRGVAANDVLLAENELSEAELRGATSSAVLRSLAVTPADATSYWLPAPRAGTVVAVNTPPGAEVGPESGSPAAVVADLDEVLVIADFSPQDAVLAHPSDRVRVTTPGTDGTLEAKIESVSEVVDPKTQTVPVRVRVVNENRALRPNGYVEVTLIAKGVESVLGVPPAAVVSDGARSVVFVETQPGVLEKRAVRLGRQGRERTEILEGLNPGERVVSSGALLLLNAIDLRG